MVEKSSSSTSKLNKKITGRGPNKIIVIPGGPGITLEYLTPFHDELTSDSTQVISYDPSGTITSSAPKQDSIEKYAEELHEVVKEYNTGSSLTLIGHSAGGAIVLQYLLEHDDTTDRAVISNGFTSGKDLKLAIQERVNQFPSDFKAKYNKFKEENNYEILGELVQKYWVPNHVLKHAEFNNDIGTSMGNFAQVDTGVYFLGSDTFNVNGAILNWDISNRLEKINTPALIISGESDYYSPERTKSMFESLPNKSFSFYDKSSHMPMYEVQDEYFKQIKSFLS